ncbi:hypothetical protein BDN67DRAFT_1015013 [Paxillus ammoniavirescens]|nr:hypothetical protein BDN67DRAFT_1015013 [Paxillus ammoniavirescens]
MHPHHLWSPLGTTTLTLLPHHEVPVQHFHSSLLPPTCQATGIPTYNFTGTHHDLSWESFGDDEEPTQAPARFGLLYFHNDAFDGRKVLLTPPMQLSPFSAPHSLPYYEPPLPFNGSYNCTIVKIAQACAEHIDKELEMLTHCELGACVTANQLMKCPPSIYYSQEESYTLHIPRGQIPFKQLYPDYCRICRLHTDLLQVTYAVLTPQQSLKCQQENIYTILVEGTLNTPVILNCSAFYQQHAPAANPFFTNDEITYLHTAVRFLRFYFQTSLADAIDLVPVGPQPDVLIQYSPSQNNFVTCRLKSSTAGLIELQEAPKKDLGRCWVDVVDVELSC